MKNKIYISMTAIVMIFVSLLSAADLTIDGNLVVNSNLTVNGTANLTATNSTALGGIDSAEYVKRDGGVVMTSSLSLGSTNRITNLSTPVATNDAATKAYVDNATNGLTGFLKADGSVPLAGNLKLNGKWLNNDGDNYEGLNVSASGNVGISCLADEYYALKANGSSHFSVILSEIVFGGSFIGSFQGGNIDHCYLISGGDSGGIFDWGHNSKASLFSVNASEINLRGGPVVIDANTNELTMGIFTKP